MCPGETLTAHGEEVWLFAYAEAVCAPFHAGDRPLRLKGRGHRARRAVDQLDPLTGALPYAMLHNPDPATLTRGKKTRRWLDVRIVREDHYQALREELLACGYCLDTSRLVCLAAYQAAKLYWEMNREPMPREMADRLRTLSDHHERAEDADLFRRIQS